MYIHRKDSNILLMIRTGIGFDIHRFDPDRPLILGGVRIANAPGLIGHSDADVLAHAIADALLGAVAAGDIGHHFPDTDPAWKNADSLDLLRRVTDMIKERGAVIINTDATVMTEIPRLAPYIDAMRSRLAEAMGIAGDAVSVKATTMEMMGAIGRQEGIAVMAVATLETQNDS